MSLGRFFRRGIDAYVDIPIVMNTWNAYETLETFEGEIEDELEDDDWSLKRAAEQILEDA